MKVKVIIEEIISQEFEVEVSSLENAYEEIRDDYKGGLIELDGNAHVWEASMMIPDEDGNETKWRNMCI